MPLKYALAVRVGLQLHARSGWEGEVGVSASSSSELRGRRVGRLGEGRRGREEERARGRKRSGVSVLCLRAAPAKKNKASATLGSDFSVAGN